LVVNAFALVTDDFVVFGIELDERGAGLHVLVVVDGSPGRHSPDRRDVIG
jgi:hypothetical protein